jgi:DNA-binding CsgD family transcriptional regulator
VHELDQSRGRARRQIDRPLAFPNARTIVENAARTAVATDSRNNITGWNPMATEVLGYTADEAIGRNFQEVLLARDIHGNPLCPDHCAFHDMVRAGDAPESFELDVFTSEDKKLRISVSIVVVLGPQAREYNLVYLMTPLRRRRRADEAIDRLLAEAHRPGSPATGAEERGRRKTPRLTRRQKEVLALLAIGRNSNEIAGELGVSVHTVRSHVQGVLKALKVSNRIEAVSRALNERLL